MAIEGKFKIIIAGRTVTRAAGQNIKRIIDQKVKMIDPDAELEERSFAGFKIYLAWTGIPKSIGQAQSLFSYLKRSLKDYFTARRFRISINLVESGE